jgi:hypothetical protein
MAFSPTKLSPDNFHQRLQEILGQTNRRLPVPHFQRDAVERYPAGSAVLSPD